MKPSIFFNGSSDVNLEKFINVADKDVIFLCDALYQDYFSALNSNICFYPLNKAQDIFASLIEDDQSKAIVVCSENEECNIVSNLREFFKGKPNGSIVVGLQTEVYAIATARVSSKLSFEICKKSQLSVIPSKAFVIFSLPRSGSYFLAELCEKMGLGMPTEHIRPNVVALSKEESGNFDLKEWIKIVAKLTNNNDIFGTKLISAFYWDAFKTTDLIQCFFDVFGREQVKCVYIYRADKYQQALSSLRARKTRIFQLTNEKLAERHKEFDCSSEDLSAEIANFFKNEIAFMQSISAKFEKLVLIKYEDLVSETAHLAGMVSKFLLGADLSFGLDMNLKNKVMRDEISEKILANFIEEQARSKSPQNRYYSWSNVSADLIKKINIPPLKKECSLYQGMDWHIVDYQLWSTGKEKISFRGPKPKEDEVPFISMFGAAQFFGRFVTKPVSHLLAEELGVEVANFGFGGVGPRFFLESAEMVSLAQNSSVFLLQAMSVRSVRNSLFDVPGNRNILLNKLTGEKETDIIAYNKVFERCGANLVNFLFEESRENWIKDNIEILKRMRGHKVFVWFSERSPGERTFAKGQDSITQVYGKFPQLVSQDMVDQISPYCDKVIYCGEASNPVNPFVSRFDGKRAAVRYSDGKIHYQDTYYSSPEMHQDAAVKIIKYLRSIGVN